MFITLVVTTLTPIKVKMKAEADMMSSSLIIESLFEYDYKSNKRSCQQKIEQKVDFCRTELTGARKKGKMWKDQER